LRARKHMHGWAAVPLKINSGCPAEHEKLKAHTDSSKVSNINRTVFEHICVLKNASTKHLFLQF
jgi:hypothetical protein